MTERTLTIVKPDAVSQGSFGKIVARLEEEGFRIVAGRMVRLSVGQARAFYAVHQGRPFFDNLVTYMTSGSVWVMALERPDAVAHLRRVMGATDPAQAAPGTIRALHGTSIERNAIHGSDSPANATIELAFFFPAAELS